MVTYGMLMSMIIFTSISIGSHVDVDHVNVHVHVHVHAHVHAHVNAAHDRCCIEVHTNNHACRAMRAETNEQGHRELGLSFLIAW